MNDKKLTDKEIVKALESRMYKENKYMFLLLQNTVDLINRLQAENERLKELIEVRHKVFETKCEELETAKAENRRLTAKNLLLEHNSTNIVSASCLYELEKQKERAERYKEKWIAETKAEAYKECIEKVEKIICDNTYPDFDVNHKAVNIWKAEAYKDINNLLKKLGG